jgi:hypothetical protein
MVNKTTWFKEKSLDELNSKQEDYILESYMEEKKWN